MAYNYPSGSGFNGNNLNSTHPLTGLKGRERTNYVSLSEWCSKNHISKNTGRTLIRKKYLIGQRLYHQWWVCANLDCLEELLEYLRIEQLSFDAENE